MALKDHTDRERIAQFAWRFVRPGEAVVISDEEAIPRGASPPIALGGDLAEVETSAVEGTEEGSESLDDVRSAAAENCAKLAAAIARAWHLGDPAAQRRAVAALVRKAEELSLSLVAMHRHSEEAVRFGRLVVRHYHRLPKRTRDSVRMVLAWLPFEHPDVADLLIEHAASGNRELYMALSLAIEDEPAPIARLGARLWGPLLRILEESPSWDARTLALDWLSIAPTEVAIPIVRRALLLPHMGIRRRAFALLNKTPPGPTADDIALLLADAIVHPPPCPSDDDLLDDGFHYATDLQNAVVRVRPPGAEEQLLRIIDGDCEYVDGCREELDRDWALETLAAANPDRARPIIDRWFLCANWIDRRMAVDAAARLPRAEAEVRLRAAAGDETPDVAEHARDAYHKLTGAFLPVDEMGILPPGFAPSAPTVEFRSRLAVLRCLAQDAREAMAEALLAQPSDDETLPLLLAACADDSLTYHPARRHLPRDRGQWGEALLARFGARALEGLCHLALRRPNMRYRSWLGELVGLCRNDGIPPAEFPRLRATAVAVLNLEAWDGEAAPIELLDIVGAPPEILDRLAVIALDETLPWHSRDAAQRVLIKSPPSETLDRRLRQALSEALAEEDLARARDLVTIGVARHIPRCIELAEAVLAAPDDSFDCALRTHCAFALRRALHLPKEWAQDTLAHPERINFGIAASIAWSDAVIATESARPARKARTTRPRRYDVSPTTLELLFAALDSPARDGAAAAEAADTLVRLKRLSTTDPRNVAVLARAPVAALPDLLFALVYRKAPLEPLFPALTRVLTTSDSEIADASESLLYSTSELRGGKSFLKGILPQVVDPGMRQSILDILQLKNEAESYWQDEVHEPGRSARGMASSSRE